MSGMIHNIKQGDTRPYLRVTLIKADGSIADVTGATVRFKMGAGSPPPMIDSPAVLFDPGNGVVEYRWAVGNTADAGQFKAEFQVTYVDGGVETYPNDDYITVIIGADLD